MNDEIYIYIYKQWLHHCFSRALFSFELCFDRSDITEGFLHIHSTSNRQDNSQMKFTSMSWHISYTAIQNARRYSRKHTWWPQPKAMSFALVRQMGQTYETTTWVNLYPHNQQRSINNDYYISSPPYWKKKCEKVSTISRQSSFLMQVIAKQ